MLLAIIGIFLITTGGCLAQDAEELPTPTVLGIAGTQFTINDVPTFLYGISYYGALGASDEVIMADLDAMQQVGFNWIRVWGTWSAFDNNVSAIDNEGQLREPWFSRLRALIAECDRRGMIVDVTLTRTDGSDGGVRLQGLEHHKNAVKALVTGLKEYRNWYFDMSNECEIGDARYTSLEDVKVLYELGKSIDPERLITVSAGSDTDERQLRKILNTGIDFITPHRPRHAKSPAETKQATINFLRLMEEFGRVIPVHYQEPFRRDYGNWQPSAEDFITDLKGAIEGGAAGWCFHNGSNRNTEDERPRRSFDLRDGTLASQIDDVELQAIMEMAKLLPQQDE